MSQVSDTGKNSDSILRNETIKISKFWMKKNAKIMKRSHAYKSYASTCSVKILNSFNPEQLKDTKYAIINKLIDLLTGIKCFKFMTTLVLEFQRIESDDKKICKNLYSNSKAETIINESHIDDVFDSICITIISNIQKSLTIAKTICRI